MNFCCEKFHFPHLFSFIEEGKNHTTEFLLCGDPDTRETVCSITCKTDEQNFIWGNGVKITADEGILHLCDVQIYAETYGKMLGNAMSLFSFSTAFTG